MDEYFKELTLSFTFLYVFNSLPDVHLRNDITVMSCMHQVAKWVMALFRKDPNTTGVLILYNELGSQREAKFTILGPGLKIVEDPLI